MMVANCSEFKWVRHCPIAAEFNLSLSVLRVRPSRVAHWDAAYVFDQSSGELIAGPLRHRHYLRSIAYSPKGAFPFCGRFASVRELSMT